jgi:hypothetical protein
MAKGGKGAVASQKISFGKKRTRVAKKSYSKYEEKPKNYGQETMSAIASTFARKSGRTLPPTGSAHY